MTIRISPLPTLLVSFLLLKFSWQFSEETIKFAVSEDASINTVIGRLEAEKSFTYRLSRGNSKIKFDDQTFEFSVSSPLDRESENAIDMLIVSSPPSIIHVLIDILDVNDNPPRFPIDIQKIEIPETAPVGWRVSISGATDPDHAENGTIGKYELVETLITVDTPAPFGVVQGPDGFVYLEVVGKLDREQRELYSMRLTATDNGRPELSASCILNIIILDTNDNPPDFGIRSITLHWNGLPNTQLFQLNATDADSGDNGHLIYRIHGPASEMFSINEHFLVTQNNTECLPRCEFVIEARDSGVPPLSTTLNVEVMVEYGNEHEPNINIRGLELPKFLFRFYPSDFPFIVVQPEDVNGKTLAILSLTDPDGPLGENATIWIENGNENSIFSLISRQSINILTLKNVENAEKEQYILEFAANDGQGPMERITRKTLKIFFKKHVKSTIIQVKKEYHVTLERSTVPGSFVEHVETNCSEMCTFELMNSDIFRIDESNGIIVTSSFLPDDVTSYHLPIRIHPPPPSTQVLETDVFVKIIQELAPKNLIRSSDDTTVHLKRVYTFSTWQNVSVGTVVGRLPRGQVYSTIDTKSELGVFPDGSIFVGKTISGDLVTLPVILEHRNTTQFSLVTVLIKPLNLHSPICHVTEIHIPENQQIGSVIGRLHATDQDSGVNGIVTYSGESSEFFVDTATGEIRNLKELDAEKRQNYSIPYEVRDLGTPSKSINCTVAILIDDVNDNAPEFSSKYYSAKISGKTNETVAILHAEDLDVTEGNRKIKYRLLNYLERFHVDQDSGKVATIQNLQKTWTRINVSVEAWNPEGYLTSRTFLLVTVTNSSQLKIDNLHNTFKIFKNDKIGSRIGKIDVMSSESLYWNSEDPRFHVDSSGDVILLKRGKASESFDVIVTSESGESQKLKFKVEYVDTDRNDDLEKVMDVVLKENSTEVLDLSAYSKNWKIERVVSDNSDSGLFIKDNILYRGEANSTIDAFVVLESQEESPSTSYKVLHVTTVTARPEISTTSCPSSVHLITPPATVTLPANCSDVSLQNPQKPLQIHENTLLIPTQSEITSHVDLLSSTIQKPFMMTLIKEQTSEDVRFATNNVLMLLSSVHPIGTSFGRVTAESAYRIRYYLVGTDKINIDADTGELFLKERFYKNLNDILIVAVIPKGIAKARVTIEVIEDRLVLTKSNFFIISPSFIKSESPLGSISIDRDDVIIDVIDDHFYVRKAEIYAKRHFTPTDTFYDLTGTVKKGKLSAPINVTLFFGSSMDKKSLKENELMFQVEENSPIGTVVGEVPNALTSKYRLIDPSCGLQIDKNGIIRTTEMFDREKTSLLKTKMIEPSENRIWDLLVFIGDVNDNSPKILNAPGRIIVSDDALNYRLIWEDLDDMASDFHFDIVDRDPFGHLEISDSGEITLTSRPSESFNATIRLYDNRPPFKVNSDDVTIEFHVEKKPRILKCVDSEFWLTTSAEIGQMTSSDSEVTWRIVHVTGSKIRFWIDPMTGKIQKASDSPVLRKGEIVELKIQVISYDAERTCYCSARIHVAQNSESSGRSLEFSNLTYEYFIPETADRFTEVGRVALNSDDDVIFKILNDFNFTISPFDGMIFTNTPLDYETTQTYNLTVTAATVTCHVIIHVIDENDESPRFITGDVVNLRIREEEDTIAYPMIIGSSIAEDLDEGQNGVVTYSLLSGNTSLFAVNSTTGDIISLAPLDREESELYELLIEAKDAGFPSLSATSKILIHVEDVNDNAPEFQLPSYFAKIQENLPIGTKILRIQATDRDSEEHARLQYSLDDDDIGTPFRIDVATGWITVAGKLDREENSEGFRIHVVASDGQKSGKVPVEILLEDVNDNSPRILNQNLDVYIPEDVTPSEVIHVIDVIDGDLEDHLKFYINDTSFKITEYGEILTTSESTFPTSIRVTVTDDVGHVTSSEYRFYKNPGREFPRFVEKMDMVTVREHEEQELAVFKAKGKNVRYGIVSRCKGDLEIEAISGILKTRRSLDREKHSECPVFVIATSFVENKPLQAITKILVKVIDINDNDPRFDLQLYHFNITENSGPTIIGHVAARDADSSRIFYEIVSGDPNHEFIISEHGQIESVRDLDRETNSEYRLILEAFDDGKPRRRGNTTVVIRVLDEDDNAPRFSRIFHVEIPEDVAMGEQIIQLSASDSDEKSSHRFELDSGGEQIPFRVEEQTGMVFVNDTLDFEKVSRGWPRNTYIGKLKSSYRIKVRLTDGAWLIETSLFVNVKDVNDNVPVFEKPEYFFVANETSPEIGQIHATDLDSNQNGKIRYSVTSPYFRIHPDSGILTKLRPLPEALVVLEVIASDHGVPRLQNSVKVYVAEQKAFGIQKTERIRESANPEDVIGEGISSGAHVFPRAIATVTRDGKLVLKKRIQKKQERFWILELEKNTMTSYVVVKEDSESVNLESKKSEETVILNLTSSEAESESWSRQQLQIPGCVVFENLENLQNPNILISRNGTLRIFAPPTSPLKVTCHDGIWPIQKLKTIDVRIQMTPETREDVRIQKPRIQKTLPKKLDVKMPSESPDGTILWILKDTPISMENSGFLNLTRGNLILTSSESLTISQHIEIFYAEFRRSTLTIHAEKETSPCPVFPQTLYFFERSSESFLENSVIHNFGWNSETMKTCGMEIEEKNPLFHTNGSSLITLKPLPPGTYQFSLLLRTLPDKTIRSQCHVTVTVPLETPKIVEKHLPTVIFAPYKNYSNPTTVIQLPSGYSIPGSANFEVMTSGAVRSRGKLTGGQIYELGAEPEVVRILTEDSEDSESADVYYHVVNPQGALKIGNITIKEVVNQTIVTSESQNLHVIKESSDDVTNLEKNAVTLEIISQKSGIAHLITDLRATYNDMRIHCLATWQISEDVKYHVIFSLVDRNGVVVEASEAQKTLTSFFKKYQPRYVEFLCFKRDVCDGVTCIQKGATCQSRLEEYSGRRLVFRSASTVFDLPMTSLIGKCVCHQGACQESQEEQRIFQKIQKDDVTRHSCDDVDCGTDGRCVLENGTLPVCRCTSGKSAFESLYSCDKASEVFSTSSGGILEISLKRSTSKDQLKCGNCSEDVQKMEFDFRTIQMTGDVLRVNFGKQMALIELISGSITFSISDEFTRPIQTQIEKRVNDGRWHRLLLQMSDDGRRISIQVDGRGKEVKSRVALPMLFTSKSIQLVTSSEFCFRRLLAQNQFVHPILSNNKFFNVNFSSSTPISSKCQFDSPESSFSFLPNFSNTTTVILLTILAIISLIALSVCLLAIRRRWRQKSSGERETERSTGWKKATEINAFAVPRRIGGHVNRSMVRSPDDDTYDVAGTQMKSTSTDDMSHIYTSSASRRYQPPVKPYQRDGHINMAYL
ncbi:CRE-CDH-3 protein [Caenorhabditis remanei]|uniref:CRE-CDH-3 protein n=1 Tax=Caenorhabditis remanei TaxID=31234 RepID=E3MKV9_CAERE|nr:CRE-CDH-3 protein [Caenorhabditis remanei]